MKPIKRIYQYLFIDSLYRRSTISVVVTLVAGALISLLIIASTHEDGFAKSDAPRFSERAVSGELLFVPPQFIDAELDIKSAPVSTPLELIIPSLSVDAEVLGVGMTKRKAMDAPMGKADSPSWQQAFWYRGSAIPGAASTSIIAGHADDPLGRDGVFAHLELLVVGDEIIVNDKRTNTKIRFAVDEIKTYLLNEIKDPDILKKIYGTGPVDGKVPEISGDGLSHLTLITCAGVFKKTTHDKRLVVYATRIS